MATVCPEPPLIRRSRPVTYHIYIYKEIYMKNLFMALVASLALVAGVAKAQEYTVTTPIVASTNFNTFVTVPAYNPALDPSGLGTLQSVKVSVEFKQTRIYSLRSRHAFLPVTGTFDQSSYAAYNVSTVKGNTLVSDFSPFPVDNLVALALQPATVHPHNYVLLNENTVGAMPEFVTKRGLVLLNVSVAGISSFTGSGMLTAETDIFTEVIITVEYNPV